MFTMKIDKQLNIADRTLVGGVATYDVVPNEIQVNHKHYKVIGLSYGVKPPMISLEIEKTENVLQGQQATAYYTYNINASYSKDVFKKVVDFIKANVDDIKETKYSEDFLDEDQTEIFTTVKGEIIVKNDFMVDAVYIESEVSLDTIVDEMIGGIK